MVQAVRAASCSLWWARTDLRQVDPLAAASLATAMADAEAALIAGSDDAPELTRTLAEETAAAYRTLEDDDSIAACG